MPSSDLPLTIEEPGVLPESRFRNYSDAADLCSQILQSDNVRAEWRSTIQKIHDGNALYSKSELEKSGQGWRCRTNYRGMEGLVQTVDSCFYDMDFEVDKPVTLELDYGKGTERDEWKAEIESGLERLIMKDWSGFDFHVQMRTRQMTLHGLGHHVNLLNNSWIPKTLKMGHLLFPDDTPVNFEEEGEFLMVRDFWTMDTLYRTIKNEKQAIAQGWNPKAVWKGMAQISKSASGSSGSSYDVERIQNLYKQGDMQYSNTRRAGIYLNFLYVQEFETGKISLYILPEGDDLGGYLFEKRNLFDSWNDIVTLFPYDIGNGVLQSIRGLGARTKEYFEMENRLLNAAADQTLTLATTLWKNNGSGIDKDSLKMLRVGQMSIIPDGLDPVVGLQSQNVAPALVELRNELKSGMKENNQSYISSAPEQKDRQTALEYSMRSQDASKVNRATVESYNRCRTRFFEGLIRRLVDSPTTGLTPASRLANKFRERLQSKGVPLEALKHIEDVAAVRSIGAGSAAARFNTLMVLWDRIYPVTSIDRRIAMERELVSVTAGKANVDRFARSVTDNDMVGQDESFAMLENDVLALGKKALVAERQDDGLHLRIHIAGGQEIDQANLNGQMPAQEAYAAIVAIGEHAAIHLNRLEGLKTRESEFKSYKVELDKLSRSADRLENEIQSQQEQPSPEQKLSEDAMLKDKKITLDAQLKEKKAALDEQRKERKAQVNEALNDARTASQIRRQQ